MNSRIPLFLLSVVLLAGCSAPAALQTGTTTAAASGKHVLAQSSFDSTSLAPSTLPVKVGHNVTSLDLSINFGRSAFTGFTFHGIPACEGLSPGNGVYPNSAEWSGSCGAVPAGSYTLSWDLTTGTAQGNLTVAG